MVNKRPPLLGLQIAIAIAIAIASDRRVTANSLC
jgi:hypothetical protein